MATSKILLTVGLLL